MSTINNRNNWIFGRAKEVIDNKELLKQYIPAYYNSINFNWIIDNKLNELKFSSNNFDKIIRIAYDDNRNIGINNMLHELKII